MGNIKNIVGFEVEEWQFTMMEKERNEEKKFYRFIVKVEMELEKMKYQNEDGSKTHIEDYIFDISVDENNEYFYEFLHSRIYSKYSSLDGRNAEAFCCGKRTHICYEINRKIGDEVFKKIIESDLEEAKAFLSRNARKKELNYDPQKEEEQKSLVYNTVATLTGEMKERFENALNLVEKERKFLLSEEVTPEEISLHEKYAIINMQNVLEEIVAQKDLEVVDRVCKYFEEKEED